MAASNNENMSFKAKLSLYMNLQILPSMTVRFTRSERKRIKKCM